MSPEYAHKILAQLDYGLNLIEAVDQIWMDCSYLENL